MTLIESPLVSMSRAGSAADGGDLNRPVVWVRGDHDIATRDELLDAVLRAARLDDADVVIDLSGVGFMDASTMDAIIDARSRLLAQGRSVSVRAPSRRARLLFEICGLVHLLDGYSDDLGSGSRTCQPPARPALSLVAPATARPK